MEGLSKGVTSYEFTFMRDLWLLGRKGGGKECLHEKEVVAMERNASL